VCVCVCVCEGGGGDSAGARTQLLNFDLEGYHNKLLPTTAGTPLRPTDGCLCGVFRAAQRVLRGRLRPPVAVHDVCAAAASLLRRQAVPSVQGEGGVLPRRVCAGWCQGATHHVPFCAAAALFWHGAARRSPDNGMACARVRARMGAAGCGLGQCGVRQPLLRLAVPVVTRVDVHCSPRGGDGVLSPPRCTFLYLRFISVGGGGRRTCAGHHATACAPPGATSVNARPLAPLHTPPPAPARPSPSACCAERPRHRGVHHLGPHRTVRGAGYARAALKHGVQASPRPAAPTLCPRQIPVRL
jgi:hypothetical protein